jgi:anti-sigma28 factor (negative regulator of flagellin synthesis)
MKIDEKIHNMDLLTAGADLVAKNKAEQSKDNTPSTEKVGQSSAEVTFSNMSVESAKVREAMEVESPERAARIKEIQAQIQSNTYHVSSADVAEKVLKEAMSDFIEP